MCPWERCQNLIACIPCLCSLVDQSIPHLDYPLFGLLNNSIVVHVTITIISILIVITRRVFVFNTGSIGFLPQSRSVGEGAERNTGVYKDLPAPDGDCFHTEELLGEYQKGKSRRKLCCVSVGAVKI